MADRLELNGIHFDREAHEKLRASWVEAETRLAEELLKILGPNVSPSSGTQLSAWLTRNLDAVTLSQWPKTDMGQLKTDAGTLAQRPHHPLIKPLFEYKEVSKLISTFGATFTGHINPVTGRIHANFLIGGTATGRFSCTSPNLQNLPRDKSFRALFTAPPGRKLIIADYSQIELRVAALISQDPVMLEAYEEGVDLHRKTAAAISGVHIDLVTKEHRQAAKAVNFGLLYGQGARGLARYAKVSYGVEMTEGQAEVARRAFFHTYRRLETWQKETGKQTKHQRA